MPVVETIVEALLIAARERPDSLAYAVDGAPITYSALLQDSLQLAGRLASHGVERGDRCGLVLRSGLDLIRGLYGSQLAGAVPVVINPEAPIATIARQLRLVRARLAWCYPDAAIQIRSITDPSCSVVDDLARGSGIAGPPRLPEPTDLAFLQLTSGTTGESRATQISQRNLIASLGATAERLEMQPADIFATWVPLHHDLGLVRYVFGAMFSACPSHLIQPSMTSLRSWLELIARTRATITGGPDSGYRLAARTVDPEHLDLRSLRFAGNGGETVSGTTIEAFERRFGVPGVMRPAYGLAEATLTVTSTAPGEALRFDAAGTVSCGRPLNGLDVRVVDADGRDQPRGEIGEIVIRGVPVFDGYFEDAEATRRTLRNGWLHTGDLASLDGQDYLFIKGRARVLIKRGGATIAPREIEDAVDRVSAVSGSAAVGAQLAADSGTEDVVVVAEIHDGHADRPADLSAIAAAIDREIRQSLGWGARRIVLANAGTIPRTAAGKVRYDELRRMVVESAFPDGILHQR